MSENTLFRQLVVFACVGVVATLVHYVVAMMIKEGAELNIYFANGVGYLMAVLVSLFGHGRFTYRRNVNFGVARRFFIVSLSTFLASKCVLFAAYQLFDLPARISLAIVVVSIPIITFMLNKSWVYAKTHA